MIQKASNEVGFEAEDIPLMVEAIPLSSESIMLVIPLKSKIRKNWIPVLPSSHLSRTTTRIPLCRSWPASSWRVLRIP